MWSIHPHKTTFFQNTALLFLYIIHKRSKTQTNLSNLIALFARTSHLQLELLYGCLISEQQCLLFFGFLKNIIDALLLR